MSRLILCVLAFFLVCPMTFAADPPEPNGWAVVQLQAYTTHNNNTNQDRYWIYVSVTHIEHYLGIQDPSIPDYIALDNFYGVLHADGAEIIDCGACGFPYCKGPSLAPGYDSVLEGWADGVTGFWTAWCGGPAGECYLSRLGSHSEGVSFEFIPTAPTVVFWLEDLMCRDYNSELPPLQTPSEEWPVLAWPPDAVAGPDKADGDVKLTLGGATNSYFGYTPLTLGSVQKEYRRYPMVDPPNSAGQSFMIGTALYAGYEKDIGIDSIYQFKVQFEAPTTGMFYTDSSWDLYDDLPWDIHHTYSCGGGSSEGHVFTMSPGNCWDLGDTDEIVFIRVFEVHPHPAFEDYGWYTFTIDMEYNSFNCDTSLWQDTDCDGNGATEVEFDYVIDQFDFLFLNPCAGDMDGDGDCDLFDLDEFTYAVYHSEAEFDAEYTGTEEYWNGDLNYDRAVNLFDVDFFVGRLGQVGTNCTSLP